MNNFGLAGLSQPLSLSLAISLLLSNFQLGQYCPPKKLVLVRGTQILQFHGPPRATVHKQVHSVSMVLMFYGVGW